MHADTWHDRVLRWTCGAAIYLFLSVFVGFNPHALSDVWRFAWRDIAQIQHITIAVLLFAVGITDLLMGRYAISAFGWHFMWFWNNSAIGFIFVIHPERDQFQTMTHQVLGFCLVMGAISLMFIKISDRYGNELYVRRARSIAVHALTVRCGVAASTDGCKRSCLFVIWWLL